jgi:uncharacterized protein
MAAFNNIACLVLSQDSTGEVWVHFGVELRGRGEQRGPQLSTFGGAIDNDELSSNPLEALKREIHEEALGLLDDELTMEKLCSVDETYSFSYTNPKDMSKTIVMATMIEHEKILNIKQQFKQERNQRLYRQEGKSFQNRAETEVKELRSVKLDDLKQYLQDFENNPQLTLNTIDAEGSFLSLDRTTIKEVNHQLIDYKVLEKDGIPIEKKIPNNLAIRPDILKSINKILPGLEYRFFNHPLVDKADLEKGFFGKTIRADEFCFINEFLDTTPIKSLAPRERISLKRLKRRKEFSARGTEIIDLKLRDQYGIGQQYSDSQKEGYSDIQSTSYFSIAHGTPAFGFSKERNTRLLGVAGLDILPNRLFIYDGGTVSRPYDGYTVADVESYIKTKALSENAVSYDISNIKEFKAKVETNGANTYNEVMARICWDLEQTSICVYSDNQETRWIACAWAKKMEERIQSKSIELHKKALITEEDHKKNMEFKVKISYYDQSQNVSGFYSDELIKSDKAEAIEIFNNLDRREQYISEGNLEFLLLIDEVSHLEEILMNQPLMKELLCNRLHIAEDIIEKFHKLTGKPFDLVPDDLILKNITRSLLEKISTGQIVGFPVIDGKIKISGFKISNKDFSGLDLRRFDFSDCIFEECAFKNIKLDLERTQHITFTDCDFRENDTTTIDFSNANIKGSFICDDKSPNFEIYSRIEDKEEYYLNFDEVKLLKLLSLQEKPNPQLIQFCFEVALYNQNHEVLNVLIEKYQVIEKLEVSDPLPIFRLAAGSNHVNAMKQLFQKFDKIDANTQVDSDEATLLHFASALGCKKMIEFLISQGGNIEAADRYKRTVLRYAIDNTQLEVIELLASFEVDLNTPLDSLPLNRASELGNETVFLRLIELGADISLAKNSPSFLIYAVKNFSSETVKKLIDLGADLNLVNDKEFRLNGDLYKGTTALIEACKSNNLEIALLLLDYGAKTESFDLTGNCALSYAAAHHNPMIIEKLLNISSQMELDQALKKAVLNRHTDLINLFLGKGASPESKDPLGRGILSYAINSKDLTLVKQYISSSTPEMINEALCEACQLGDTSLINFLIEKGANIDSQNRNKESPLVIAVSKKDKNLVKMLLDLKANPNCTNQFNRSALELALNDGQIDVYEALIKAGAKWEANHLKSAFVNAIEKGHNIVFNRLLSLIEKDDLNNAFSKAVETKNKYVFNRLLYSIEKDDLNKAFLEASEKENHFAFNKLISMVETTFIEKNLAKLSKIKNTKMFKQILLKIPDADLETPSLYGAPLHYAFMSDKYDIADLLCKAGANVDSLRKDGRMTRLMFECQRERPNLQHIKEILKLGADPLLKNKSGDSAISLAKKMNNLELVEFLERNRDENAIENQKKRVKERADSINKTKLNASAKWSLDEAGKNLADALSKKNSELAMSILHFQADAIFYTGFQNPFKEVMLCSISLCLKVIELHPKLALEVSNSDNGLTWAIKQKEWGLAKLIAERCPETVSFLMATYPQGQNSLAWAILNKMEDFARHLFKCAPESADNLEIEGKNILELALEQKLHPLANELFNQKPYLANHVVGPDDFLNHGKNVLMLAVESGNIALAREIITKYPDSVDHKITEGYQKGKNLLSIAIEANQQDFALELINQGTDLHHADKNAHTVLHTAIEYKCEKVLSALIQNKVKLNPQNHQGQTPLMRAIQLKNSTMVKMLVEAGADCTLLDKDNKSALDYCDESMKQLITDSLNTMKSTNKKSLLTLKDMHIMRPNNALEQTDLNQKQKQKQNKKNKKT